MSVVGCARAQERRLEAELMAVCGRCWICGDKGECVERQSCGDCTEHKPLEISRREGGEPVPLSRFEARPPWICGRCEEDIDSGALGSLVHALRARR